MSSPQPTSPINIVPRTRTESLQSTDSEILSSSPTMSPPERRFSLSGMLGRRVSISEAYQKYAGFTINGDGFQKENYVKQVETPPRDPRAERHNQEFFLP